MAEMHFGDRLAMAVREKSSILCVGLDPRPERLPKSFLAQAARELASKEPLEVTAYGLAVFCVWIIEQVAPYSVAVKPNLAFFEPYGDAGLRAYEKVCRTARKFCLIVIGDGKRSDGRDSAESYARGHLGRVPFYSAESGGFEYAEGPLSVDALTVEPYIGEACLNPYVQEACKNRKGVFVVVRTSFDPPSFVEELRLARGQVWNEVAMRVHGYADCTLGESGYSNIGAVLGATRPVDALRMRELLPKSWFLLPGYGAQGGGEQDAVRAMDRNGLGVLVTSSRTIMYHEEPAVAARSARDVLMRAVEERRQYMRSHL